MLSVYGSLHVSCLDHVGLAKWLTPCSAVHNFCTSQKAVSSQNSPGLHGIHRGGELDCTLTLRIGLKVWQHIFLVKNSTTSWASTSPVTLTTSMLLLKDMPKKPFWASIFGNGIVIPPLRSTSTICSDISTG